MLTRRENQINLKCFKILGKLFLAPLHVDLENYVIEPKVDRKSRAANSVLPIIVQLHVLYALYRFHNSVKVQGISAIATASVDYAVIVFGELGLYSVFECFFRAPALAKLLCRNLIISKIDEKRDGMFVGYKLTEVCIMLLPLALFPAVVILSFMYGSIYLWTKTGDSSIGNIWEVMFLLAEFTTNLCWMSFCYSTALLHIEFFQKISYDLQGLQTAIIG